MRYLLLLILFVSCNPVKQVLRDQDKLEEVAKVVVKGGGVLMTLPLLSSLIPWLSLTL